MPVCLRFALAILLTLGLPGGLRADWRTETVLVSPGDGATEVRHPGAKRVLFSHPDPQEAIEWGMAHATATVVLAGEYTVADRIDVPRPGVTLVIAEGALLRLDPAGDHTWIGFKARNPDYWQMVPLIYNRGHDDVRILVLGTLEKWRRETETRGRQTLPLMFDGRNAAGDCGVEGGMLVVAGRATESFFLIDAAGVEVPLVSLDTGPGAVLVLEGCEDCHLGMIASVAPEDGGQTAETVDLNSRCLDITIERLLGERAEEIIDCNESHVVVEEAVSIGEPRKLFGRGPVSGPRFTDRRGFGSRSLDVRRTTILRDATRARLVHELPRFPEDLPRFTVATTVEIELAGGERRRYRRAVEIDLGK